MRLLSATGFLAVAVLASGCSARMYAPPADQDETIVAQLAELGVEGRSYQTDLGDAYPVRVHRAIWDNGDLLVEDIHGHLTYVDGATLNPRWDFYGLPGTFDYAPDFTPSAIIGISKGTLYVVTRANGIVSPAPQKVGIYPSAGPVSTESTMYVPSYPTPGGNKTVNSISLGNGFRGWGVRTEDDILSDLAKGGPLGGDTFYFATADGQLWAFPTNSASEGAPEAAWYAHAKAPIYHDLVVDGDDLGVVTADGRLVCYDRITGNVRWEAYPNSNERAESQAQFSASNAYYRIDGELRAYDRATGAHKWSVDGGSRFVAERGSTTVIEGDDGWYFSVESATGKKLEEHHMPGVKVSCQGGPDSTVYAITKHGLLLAVEHGW